MYVKYIDTVSWHCPFWHYMKQKQKSINLPIAGQTFKTKMLFNPSFFLSKHRIRLPKSPSHLNPWLACCTDRFSMTTGPLSILSTTNPLWNLMPCSFINCCSLLHSQQLICNVTFYDFNFINATSDRANVYLLRIFKEVMIQTKALVFSLY